MTEKHEFKVRATDGAGFWVPEDEAQAVIADLACDLRACQDELRRVRACLAGQAENIGRMQRAAEDTISRLTAEILRADSADLQVRRLESEIEDARAEVRRAALDRGVDQVLFRSEVRRLESEIEDARAEVRRAYEIERMATISRDAWRDRARDLRARAHLAGLILSEGECPA